MKRVFIFVLLIGLIAGLSGCSSKGDSADDIEARKICNFKRIYNNVDFGVLQQDALFVDELTGVIYVAIRPYYYGGGFTPLYNADGTLKIWDGYKKGGGSNVQQEVKAQD